MTDDKELVKRLREPPFGTETSERNLMASAADVIERLTTERDRLAAALDLAANRLWELGVPSWAKTARAALEGEKP